MAHNQFIKLLDKINTDSIVVIDETYAKNSYVPLDLSSSNIELKNVNVSNSDELGEYIKGSIQKKKGLIAFGGYLETREIYQRSTHFNKKVDPLDERNIHLGIDIWSISETKVLAVLDGIIHSFKNNLNYGDYGPTIILEHKIKSSTFYTLYGHLSEDSLKDFQVGDLIQQGEVIGTLGSSKVNGDYPPHLHFQIILDIENYNGDYPGVSSLNTMEFYKGNCPDPNLLLGL